MELFFIDKNNLAEAVSSARQGKRILLISDSNVEAVVDMINVNDSYTNIAKRIKEIETIPLFLDDTPNPTLLHIKEMCEKYEIQKIYFID